VKAFLLDRKEVGRRVAGHLGALEEHADHPSV